MTIPIYKVKTNASDFFFKTLEGANRFIQESLDDMRDLHPEVLTDEKTEWDLRHVRVKYDGIMNNVKSYENYRVSVVNLRD